MNQRVVAVLVLPLLLTAGCGGGSAKASGAAARTTYLATVEPLCSKGNAEKAALVKPTSAAELAPYVAGIARIAQTTITAVAAVAPPKVDRAALDKKVFDPLHKQLGLFARFSNQVSAAGAAKDDAALVRLLGDPPTTPLADLDWMTSYGFKECEKLANTSS